jgi:hypothetical protein
MEQLISAVLSASLLFSRYVFCKQMSYFYFSPGTKKMAIFAKIRKNRQIVKTLNFKVFGRYRLCIFATTSMCDYIKVKNTILPMLSLW